MGKFLVRLTIVITALYFVLAYLIAQFLGVDIMFNNYAILFELCVVVYCFSEGAYHCKYIKYTALAILLCDVITQLDNRIDFMTTSAHNLILISMIGVGILTGVFLAIKHFIRVKKLKKQRYGGII